MRQCVSCGAISSSHDARCFCGGATVPYGPQTPSKIPMKEDEQLRLFAHLPEQRRKE